MVTDMTIIIIFSIMCILIFSIIGFKMLKDMQDEEKELLKHYENRVNAKHSKSKAKNNCD